MRLLLVPSLLFPIVVAAFFNQHYVDCEPAAELWYHKISVSLYEFYNTLRESSGKSHLDLMEMGLKGATMVPVWVSQIDEASKFKAQFLANKDSGLFDELSPALKAHLALYGKPADDPHRFRGEAGNKLLSYAISDYLVQLAKNIRYEGLNMITLYSHMDMTLGLSVFANLSQMENLVEKHRLELPRIEAQFRDIEQRLQKFNEEIKSKSVKVGRDLKIVREIREDYSTLNGTIRNMQIQIKGDIITLDGVKDSTVKYRIIPFVLLLTGSLVALAICPPAALAGAVVGTVGVAYNTCRYIATGEDIAQLNVLYGTIEPLGKRTEAIYRNLMLAEEWYIEVLEQMEENGQAYSTLMRNNQ